MTAPTGSARLVGIDVARCLALLGMMATHLLLETDLDGSISAPQWLAGGRASSLFAVLAGVSIALMTGGRKPVRGAERRARAAGLVVRAGLIAFLGLILGEAGSGLAVILTYYGLLFVLALPFLALRPPALLSLGAVWIVVGPLLNTVVRGHLPFRGAESPRFDQLTDPGRLLGELLFTGYYPVLPWLAYLLVGMGLGRLDLRVRRVQATIAVAGAILAVVATQLSHWLTAQPRVQAALLGGPGDIDVLLAEIQLGMFGTTPKGGSWAWMLVVAPHSSTPFDLAQTIGSAALVIGTCLLLVGLVSSWEVGLRFVQVFFGAGAMTLSLYTLHVFMRTPEIPPAEEPDAYLWHVLVVLGTGAVFAAGRHKGPLEWVVAQVSGSVTRRVRSRAAS